MRSNTSTLNIEISLLEKTSLEKMNSEQNPSLGWQSPSRNLLLAMASTILLERGVQKGSIAITCVSMNLTVVSDLL